MQFGRDVPLYQEATRTRQSVNRDRLAFVSPLGSDRGPGRRLAANDLATILGLLASPGV